MENYAVINKTNLENKIAELKRLRELSRDDYYSFNLYSNRISDYETILNEITPLRSIVEDAWDNGSRAGWHSGACQFDGTEAEMEDLYNRDPKGDYIRDFKIN